MASFKNFQLQGRVFTEKELEPYLRLIIDDYEEAAKVIRREMKSYYSKYLVGVKPENYYNVMIQYDRLDKMLKEIETEYKKYTRLAGNKIGSASEMAMTNNYYRQRYALSFVEQPNPLSFGVLNTDLVGASVFGTQKYWDSDVFLLVATV